MKQVLFKILISAFEVNLIRYKFSLSRIYSLYLYIEFLFYFSFRPSKVFDIVWLFKHFLMRFIRNIEFKILSLTEIKLFFIFRVSLNSCAFKRRTYFILWLPTLHLFSFYLESIFLNKSMQHKFEGFWWLFLQIPEIGLTARTRMSIIYIMQFQ